MRPVELTTEDLERPEDDPREYTALRHNLRQVQREVEQAQRLFTAQVEEVRREYETSELASSLGPCEPRDGRSAGVARWAARDVEAAPPRRAIRPASHAG
jgi:hypothetical protein